MNYDRDFEEFFGRNTMKMVDAVLYPKHYENEKKMMKLAWDAALRLKDKEIIKISESNMELSLMLLGNRKDTRDTRSHQVSYLFGKPLSEIYDILIEHEKRNAISEIDAGSGVWIRKD